MARGTAQVPALIASANAGEALRRSDDWTARVDRRSRFAWILPARGPDERPPARPRPAVGASSPKADAISSSDVAVSSTTSCSNAAASVVASVTPPTVANRHAASMGWFTNGEAWRSFRR